MRISNQNYITRNEEEEQEGTLMETKNKLCHTSYVLLFSTSSTATAGIALLDSMHVSDVSKLNKYKYMSTSKTL